MTRILALVLLAGAVFLVAWSCSEPHPDPGHCLGPLTAYERWTCVP